MDSVLWRGERLECVRLLLVLGKPQGTFYHCLLTFRIAQVVEVSLLGSYGTENQTANVGLYRPSMKRADSVHYEMLRIEK